MKKGESSGRGSEPGGQGDDKCARKSGGVSFAFPDASLTCEYYDGVDDGAGLFTCAQVKVPSLKSRFTIIRHVHGCLLG